MNWATLITLLLKVLKERADAGFPFLVMLLKLFGLDIQKSADNDTSAITVGAAPDEVKDQLMEWLEALRAGTSRRALRWGIGLLMLYVPKFADEIWDSLFQAGKVSQPLSHFTPATVGASGDTDESILAAA